jgi:cold shock CspA family protein
LGFEPIDMSLKGTAAVIDAELVAGKLSLQNIHLIGEVLPRLSEPVLSEESEELCTIETYGRKIGDLVVAHCVSGFDRTRPDFGFFQPADGGRNIFVHHTKVNARVFSQIWDKSDLQVDVMVIDINSKGLVGRIDTVHVPAKPKLSPVQPVMSTSAAASVADKQQKVEAKRQRQQALLAREKVTVVTAGGANFFGIPVMESEWESVPDGTSVVLVEYFDQETGHVSRPLEYFVVQKPGGKPAKQYRKTEVSLLTEEASVQMFAKKTVTPLCAIGVGFFKTDAGTLVSAPIYEPKSKADVDQLAGIISRTKEGRIAIKQGGTYHLGTVTREGLLHRLAATLQQKVSAAA